MAEITYKTIFDRTSGATENYRIPSVVVTAGGVTVACCDARHFTGGDNPNKIDKVIRRSMDSGETWEDVFTIVAEVGESKDNSSAAIDPVMCYNPYTGRIIMLYSHTPAGIGILNSKRCVGQDAAGRLIMKVSGKKGYLGGDGKVYYADGRESGYTADEDGYCYLNGERVGNYKLHGSPVSEEPTSFLYETHSDDEGLTWSRPVCLNSSVKKKYMTFIGAGPGIGVTLTKGENKGRVVMPIYFGTAKRTLSLSAVTVYSDDNGVTWKMGVPPNDSRKGMWGIKLNSRYVLQHQMTTETQIIEQESGTLKMFLRNHSPKRRVAVCYSDDGGVSWRGYRLTDLPQPICQQSVVKFVRDGKPYVVFVNAASEKKRENGTVRLSLDDGETFPYSRRIKDGEFVYSSVCVLPDGNIGVLYEGETAHTKIDLAKFPIEWITEGGK